MTVSYVIHSVEGNRQRLDGGAMFGNVPRALWADWAPPDERHRIELACRCFLIEDRARGRRLLLEAGVGVFFHPRFADRFGVAEPEHVLLQSLTARGVTPADIDVVVLSHLHFDHAGGLLTPWRADGGYELVFPRAQVVVGRRAWERARTPHQRDRASFIPELLRLLEESGRLVLEDGPQSATLGADFTCHTSDGHTPGLRLVELAPPGGGGSLVFCGDLVPGRPWIHLPVTMGYDRFPELLIEEKELLLERCRVNGTRLLLTHDPGCAMCGVARDERGRYVPVDAQPTVDGLEL